MSVGEAQPMKEDSEEEVDRDSPDTDQSTQSADSSDDGFESDDSSEMDNEENEKRRIECLENIADIERQFTGLREQLYRERLNQVEYKLSEVKMGCAVEYLEPLAELEESCRIKTEVAAVLKQFRINNICNQFEAEELAAKQNLDSERMLLWDSIKEELEEKIRHLEEDRNNVDISSDLWLVEHSLLRGSKSKRGAQAKQISNKPYADMVSRRKPVTVTGPYIVYMLHDNDIIEDWTIIKKALSVNKRKESKYF